MKTAWSLNEVQGIKKIARMMVLAIAATGAGVAAGAQTPSAPEMSPATAAEQQATVPPAPALPKAPVDPFPPVNLKDFTASSPTTAEVDAFLKAMWGYDENRIWRVAAIEKTAAPGVVRVVVFAADKTVPGKVNRNEFFVTPDGAHAISGDVVDFGARPFAARQALLQQKADGPAEGAADKGLLLAVFGDLLNAQSKQMQASVDKLMHDIPQVRVVFENLPAQGSPYALYAAEEGVCVRQAKGDAAFFTYVEAVYRKQGSLTVQTLQPTLDAAIKTAGADPKSVDACAASPAAKADVEASIALANEAGISEAPALVIDGRLLPPVDIPYDALKQIVAYQAKRNGLDVQVQPTLSNLK